MSFIIHFTAAANSRSGSPGSSRAPGHAKPGIGPLVTLLLVVTASSLASAQGVAEATDLQGDAELKALVATALTRSPTVHAAIARLDGARHRAIAANAPPDPMLMAGIQNQPLGKDRSVMAASGPDPMTMRMVGVSQSIPYPGKLALRRVIAEREADAGTASVEMARLLVERDVKHAYYELAFLDQARQLVDRNRDVLASLIRVTDARYGLGRSGQSEILKARLDGTRLAETASDLAEQRSATLARLNRLLDGTLDISALRPVIPARIVRIVMPAADEIRFTSNALGSRAAGSPLRPLSELQDAALANSAELREHEAMIGAQAARVALARRERLPDIDVALQYGQRGGGLPDMVSASVSVPLPLFAHRKQDELTGDAAAQLEALHAEHQASADALRAEVASLVSGIERARTQLALSMKALVPQGRAMLSSATSSYQAGKGELRDVLDAQATLFTYETEAARALADFAKQLAELERLVGTEVIR